MIKNNLTGFYEIHIDNYLYKIKFKDLFKLTETLMELTNEEKKLIKQISKEATEHDRIITDNAVLIAGICYGATKAGCLPEVAFSIASLVLELSAQTIEEQQQITPRELTRSCYLAMDMLNVNDNTTTRASELISNPDNLDEVFAKIKELAVKYIKLNNLLKSNQQLFKNK